MSLSKELFLYGPDNGPMGSANPDNGVDSEPRNEFEIYSPQQLSIIRSLDTPAAIVLAMIMARRAGVDLSPNTIEHLGNQIQVYSASVILPEHTTEIYLKDKVIYERQKSNFGEGIGWAYTRSSIRSYVQGFSNLAIVNTSLNEREKIISATMDTSVADTLSVVGERLIRFEQKVKKIRPQLSLQDYLGKGKTELRLKTSTYMLCNLYRLLVYGYKAYGSEFSVTLDEARSLLDVPRGDLYRIIQSQNLKDIFAYDSPGVGYKKNYESSSEPIPRNPDISQSYLEAINDTLVKMDESKDTEEVDFIVQPSEDGFYTYDQIRNEFQRRYPGLSQTRSVIQRALAHLARTGQFARREPTRIYLESEEQFQALEELVSIIEETITPSEKTELEKAPGVNFLNNPADVREYLRIARFSSKYASAFQRSEDIRRRLLEVLYLTTSFLSTEELRERLGLNSVHVIAPHLRALQSELLVYGVKQEQRKYYQIGPKELLNIQEFLSEGGILLIQAPQVGNDPQERRVIRAQMLTLGEEATEDFLEKRPKTRGLLEEFITNSPILLGRVDWKKNLFLLQVRNEKLQIYINGEGTRLSSDAGENFVYCMQALQYIYQQSKQRLVEYLPPDFILPPDPITIARSLAKKPPYSRRYIEEQNLFGDKNSITLL